MNPDNQPSNPQNNFQQPYGNGQNPNQNPRVVDSIQPPTGTGNVYGGNVPGQQVSPQNYQQQSNPQNNFQQPQQNNGIPTPNQQMNFQSPQDKGKSKKPKILIVLIAGVSIVALLTVIAILVMPKKKPASQQQNNNQTQESPDSSLNPAEAIDVEKINNSINQDSSGLNVEDDFPASQLDDKALNL